MPRPADWRRRDQYVYEGAGRLWIRITVTLPGGRRVDYGPRQCPEEWGCTKTAVAKAHVKACEIAQQMMAGQLDRSRAVEETFLEFADRVRAAKPMRARSLQQWQYSRALWADSLGALPVRAVTLEDVKRWFASYLATTEHSPKTIQVRIHMLRFALRAAHLEGLHVTNFGRVLTVQLKKDEVRRNLSVDELAPAFAGPWAESAVFWAVLSVTGMRRGELEGLRPHELRDGCICLSAERTKTNRPRKVPIPAELWPALTAFAAVNPGTYAAQQARTREGQRGFKACGLLDDGFTVHSLRRMAVTELSRLGFRRWLVQILIGHTTGTMTDSYDGAQASELAQMVEQYWAQRVRRVYALALNPHNPTE